MITGGLRAAGSWWTGGGGGVGVSITTYLTLAKLIEIVEQIFGD
jgi:hypothetical protein